MDLKKIRIILVLGAKLDGQGVPKNTLAYRLNLGLEIFRKGDIFLISGNPKEISGMRRYLHNYGVDLDSIIVEDKSMNSLDNLINSRKIINFLYNENISKEIIVITNKFHMPRIKSICQFIQWKELSFMACRNPNKSFLKVYVREKLAYIKWIIQKSYLT